MPLTTLRNKAVREKYSNASGKPVHDRLRNGEHQLQSSGQFLIECGLTAHPLSVPGKNSSSQLSYVPVTDASNVKSKWVDYEPVQIGTNPMKSLSDYIDIQKTELRLVIEITKKKGGDIAPGKKYILINNALHSLIKEFTIKLNETLITDQSDT